ncbi:MAG: O-antigen ligase family protein [Chromatiales bacterium]|nr:O-antigen ligase family protein [Chromatiales bacterium]
MTTSSSIQTARYSGRESALIVCALVYSFVVHFGVFFRLSADQDSLGLSSILASAIVLLGAVPAIVVVAREVIYRFLVALLAAVTVGAVTSSTGLSSATLNAAQFAFYIALSASVAACVRSPLTLRHFWIAASAGLMLSGALTLIDFYGFYDVPRNNELGISTETALGRVDQASGFFFNRSSMAALFVFTITGTLVLALGHGGLLFRLNMLIAGGTGFVTVVLTHNRSAVVGSLIAIAVYALRSSRFRGSKRVVGLAILAGILIGFGVLISAFFPEQLAVYTEKLAFVTSGEEASQSDRSRLELLKIAISSLTSYPFGHGITEIRYGLMQSDQINAHNVFTGLLWAAGVLFIAWLPPFLIVAVGRVRRIARFVAVSKGFAPYIDAIQYGLLAWMLHNMTHFSLNTGLVWVALGLMLSTCHLPRQRSDRRIVPTPQAALARQ